MVAARLRAGDDEVALRLAQMRERGVRGLQNRQHIELDHLVPFLGIAVLDPGFAGAHPGIGEHRVEPAEMRDGLFDRIVERGAVGDVAFQRQRRLADLGCECVELVARARQQRDVPAGPGGGAGAGGADPGGSAGDEECSGHVCPFEFAVVPEWVRARRCSVQGWPGLVGPGASTQRITPPENGVHTPILIPAWASTSPTHWLQVLVSV